MNKKCNFCGRKVPHNNKIGFCIDCTPKGKIIKSFNNGKTITEISREIFNSNSGSYRSMIRNILKDRLGSNFESIKVKNKDKVMKEKTTKKIPLEFVKDLYNKGLLTPQIHKALISKGYIIHICTLRKRMKELNLDGKENHTKWLTGRHLVSKGRKKLIKELWMNGESINNIAKVTNLAHNTVGLYLNEMGCKTRLLQMYFSEKINKEEEKAKEYLEHKGFEVKKCLFLCQRKVAENFNSILENKDMPFPKDLKKFCEDCPIKKLKFKEQELYDFVIKKENHYGIVEVKKVYLNPYRRAHFTLGQFINLPTIIKHNINFSLIIFEGGKMYEEKF